MKDVAQFGSPPSQDIAFEPPILGVGAWAGHVPFAYDLVYFTQPKLIVELGVDRGESLLAFSHACEQWAPACKITGIDSWEGDPHAGSSSMHLYESVLGDITCNGFKNTQLIRGLFEHQVSNFKDGSIDILHIDGWHTYQAVANDWALFIKKVRKGGIILIHDTRVVGGEFGVHLFFDELKKEYPFLEFTHFFGLGVIENRRGSTFQNPFLKHLSKDVLRSNKSYQDRFAQLKEKGATHPTRIQHTESVASEFLADAEFENKKQNCCPSLRDIPLGCINKTEPELHSFSILTPVYKPQKAHITAALASIQALTYSNWEWVVVIDGPDPEAQQLLANLAATDSRIKLICSPENRHISATLNAALKAAKNKWCCVLDQDDLLAPEALSIANTYINEYPKARLFYSDEDKIDNSGAHTFSPFLKPGFQPDLILSQNYFNHLTFFTREDAQQVNGFDDTFRGCQDWDFFLKILSLEGPHNVVHIPYILYHWRSHPKSTAQSLESKPYVLENALKCAQKHGPLDATYTLNPAGYVARHFKKKGKKILRIFYRIENTFHTSDDPKIGAVHLCGSRGQILSEISRLAASHSEYIIYLQPVEYPYSEERAENLCGYASCSDRAFVAPHLYDSVSHSFINTFSIDSRGLAIPASDDVSLESEGYFMNLALTTNPDILDLSFCAFQARYWLELVTPIQPEPTLSSIANEVYRSNTYFCWVPLKVAVSRVINLFDLGDTGDKTIKEYRHFVSPARSHFASKNEDSNTRLWTGLCSQNHE